MIPKWYAEVPKPDLTLRKGVITPTGFSGIVFYYDDKTYKFLKNGFLHRRDGPAYINEVGFSYWIEGKRHRLDGPAIETHDGSYKEWWIDGQQYNTSLWRAVAIEYKIKQIIKF